MSNFDTMPMGLSLTFGQRVARQMVMRIFDNLQCGQLTVTESYQTRDAPLSFGNLESDGPVANLNIHHPGLYRRVLRGGSIAAAEAYIDGWWDSTQLTELIRLLAKNDAALDALESSRNLGVRLLLRFQHWLKRNTVAQSRDNILAHYDLGNELYSTFLDKNMLYSSALFSPQAHGSGVICEGQELEQAQLNKMMRLCEQLQLSADDHVLEIGSGWGGMAIFMAKNYGCRVTTTTISDAQYAYARNQITRYGLTEKINLLHKDYRQLSGQYDKLVSIEMIEAVGEKYLPQFIRCCQARLRPGGLMALQLITIADQRYDNYSHNVDFIQKYIFPGGFLPSASALLNLTSRHSDFVVRNMLDIGLDYAQTLHHWQARFEQQLQQINQLGYDERFIRLWRYYFCYCRGGFLARTISALQITLQRN